MGKFEASANKALSGKSVSANETKFDFVQDNFIKPRGRNVVLSSPPKHGKTYTSATMSEFWDQDQIGKKRIELEDTIFILTDKGGTDTLKALNVKVDQIPVYEFFGNGSGQIAKPNDLIHKIIDQVTELVESGGKKLVIFDTVSAWDDMEEYYYEYVSIPRTTQGNRDSFAIHRIMTNNAFGVWARLVTLPCDIVFNFHTKMAGESALKKAKAEAMPKGSGMINTIIDTKFQDTASIYRKHNSLVGSIQIEKGQRWLYSTTFNGIEGGNRYEHILDVKEPPHLGKIFNKIDQYIGEDKK